MKFMFVYKRVILIILFFKKFLNFLFFDNFLKFKKVINKISIIFSIKNKLTLDRAIFYYEKETLDWINGFEENKIFWDIGSCTCVYSIYAVKKNNIRTFAFEADYLNFLLGKENIKLNKEEKNCSIFNFLIGSKTSLVNLKTNSDFGLSFQPKKNLSYDNPTLSFRLDDLMNLEGMQFPNYIKIDVERSETDLIKGGKNFFKNKILNSIMIEISKKNFRKINYFFYKNNFVLNKKFAQSNGDANYLYLRSN